MSLPLALTLGEPAGIGADITLAAWRRRAELALPAFYLLADPKFLADRAKRLALDIPIAVVEPAAAAAAFRTALPVVDIGIAITAQPGHPDQTSAPAALAAIHRAVADVRTGMAAAVVTNPVAKNVLYRAGFAEPGHTEYLAKLAQGATGKPVHPVMLLWSPELAVVPVTIHLPLREVVARLSADLIVRTGRIVARDFAARFGIARPRLAVAGLNPHAGEEGALGKEDLEVVRPAVERLRRGHRRARAVARRHLVPRRRARRLRRGPRHVPRPGADPDQDHCIRSRCERHARAAIRAHLARPRHCLRYRRLRSRRSFEPDRRARAGGPARRPVAAAAGRAARMSAIDDLPPLREVISRHGLRAKRSLGQNFLLDLNLTARIARAAGPLEDVTIIEIGPGPGGLTRALLAAGARRVIAVERDQRAIAALAEIAAHYPGRLDVVAADALELDPSSRLNGERARIVANLPYNIATVLLVSWLTLEPWPPWYDRLILMFQREVAERIAARPGTKSYGRLSVLAGWRSEARILFDVGRHGVRARAQGHLDAGGTPPAHRALGLRRQGAAAGDASRLRAAP